MRKATITEWKKLGKQMLIPVMNAGMIAVIITVVLFAYIGALAEDGLSFPFNNWLRATIALYLPFAYIMILRHIKKSGLKYRDGKFYFKERKPGLFARLFFNRGEENTETKTSG